VSRPGSSSDPSDGTASAAGPAEGTYDPVWVASSARQSDPGLPEETARQLATEAWEHLRGLEEADAPTLARALLADHPEAGATAANMVATAALEFCASHDVAR